MSDKTITIGRSIEKKEKRDKFMELMRNRKRNYCIFCDKPYFDGDIKTSPSKDFNHIKLIHKTSKEHTLNVLTYESEFSSDEDCLKCNEKNIYISELLSEIYR